MISPRTEIVLGADEVGYGALAGPLVISIVAVPLHWMLEGLRDSKKLTPKKRAAFDERIKEYVVLEAVLDPARIDEMGGGVALQWLHKQAAKEARAIFPTNPLFIDGNIPVDGCISLVKADDIVPAVMAASVHAKVFRDRYMEEVLHKKYPQYQFDMHKGYGTSFHYDALQKHGPCEHHRKSFLKFDGNVVRKPAGITQSGPELRRDRWGHWPKMRILMSHIK